LTRVRLNRQSSAASTSTAAEIARCDIPFRGILRRVAIADFADRGLELFFAEGRLPRGVAWRNVANLVARKLDMIRYAEALTDLRSPPGNRLEALRGDLAGYHSIRINDQWRVVFRWTNRGAESVRVVDYH
jgi:toxin HigB-1